MQKEFKDLDLYLKLDASGLANTVLHCPVCGMEHRVPLQKIQIGDGLIDALPEIAVEIIGAKPRKPALIYDKAIEEIIRGTLVDKLPEMHLSLVGLGEKNSLLEADVRVGDEAVNKLAAETDVIIGAGSGVIADLTKWIATKVNKPFILYGTAPSMNAHTSITSTMTIEGIKSSILLNPARAILFDVPVLTRAPQKMRLAGIGDLVARTICNADWKLANLIRKKYFCPVPYQLTGMIEPLYLQAAQDIGLGEATSVRILGEAILVSGISMTIMDGETSPSSGCEHVFSHYWDLQVELEGAPKNLHGIQVGIGTRLSYALFETMRDLDITQIDPQNLLRRRPSLEALEDENKAKFGSKAPSFNEVLGKKWKSDNNFVPYLQDILDRWQATWEALAQYIGRLDAIQKPMESAGFVFSLDTIQRTRRQVLDALVYGSRYRSRYTLLDLAWELGILPEASEEILDRSGLV